jgi:hypothetical protein
MTMLSQYEFDLDRLSQICLPSSKSEDVRIWLNREIEIINYMKIARMLRMRILFWGIMWNGMICRLTCSQCCLFACDLTFELLYADENVVCSLFTKVHFCLARNLNGICGCLVPVWDRTWWSVLPHDEGAEQSW